MVNMLFLPVAIGLIISIVIIQRYSDKFAV